MPRRSVQPIALLLGSVAYIYSTFNNLAELPGATVVCDTTYGQLRGSRSTARNGRLFYEFLGVPYAEPPVGDLRFEPPIPPEKWYGIRDALRYGPRCWQFERFTRTVQGSEDCLTLNIYTSQILEDDQIPQAILKPVLVFIHGGAFMAGLSNFYRPKYFMSEDVVLVTLNYRLASFGFLNTGDDVVRGNMGLKDQSMALKFIQENIGYFGGDNTKVTLMGESAGAASVHLHTLSPMSKGLFHRAISQSGSSLNPWVITSKPREQAQRLARLLSCPTETSEDMVNCLKSRSARSIVRTHIDYSKEFVGDRLALFSPTVETVNDSNAFLTEHPRKLLTEGNIANPVPWVVGVNSHEGLIYAANALTNKTQRRLINENWKKIAPIVLYYDDNPQHVNISSEIRKQYLGTSKVSMNTLEQTVNIFSDREFFQGIHDSIRLHSKSAPVYAYYYSYQGTFGFANLLFSMTGSLPASLDAVVAVVSTTRDWFRSNVLRRGEQKNYGTCHGDELPIFYNIPFITREIMPGTPDYPFSNSIVKLWVSFARNGTPDDFRHTKWTKVDPTQGIKYLHLDDLPEMISAPFESRVQFWNSLNIDEPYLQENNNTRTYVESTTTEEITTIGSAENEAFSSDERLSFN